MGVGSFSEGLYFWTHFPSNFSFSSASFNKTSLCNLTTNEKNFIMHSRMGHSTFFPYTQCSICPLAKQSHNLFPLGNTRANEILSLIHVDIWGPYHTANHEGSRYFLTIVDDCSRATWIFLMQSKGQAYSHLKTFITLSKNQFGKSIKRIRTDNGRKFFSHDCTSLFSSHGIQHESSCIYTPQQNGVVEHKHRHLLEVARALKFQAAIPDEYWGECVITAT